MQDTRIAILGLDGSGESLLERLVGFGDAGPQIVCAVEAEDGVGRRKADALGIALLGINELVGLGEEIDIVFALNDDGAMQTRLRQALAVSGNQHTQVLSEKELRLMEMLLDGWQTYAA